MATQQYYYYYYDGLGDYYYGYGYAASNTYTAGYYDYYSGTNESGANGFYYIYSISDVDSSYDAYQGNVYVTYYYDAVGDNNWSDHNSGGAGYSESLYGGGYNGLGSEGGYVYNADYNAYDWFGYDYYTADYQIGASDVYTYYYVTNTGDYYYGYGYGYAPSGTYYTGEVWYTYNETGDYGYYYIAGVSGGYGNAYDGLVYVQDYWRCSKWCGNFVTLDVSRTLMLERSAMDSTALFTVALGLQSPWEVEDIRFEPEAGEIHFDLVCGAKRLACPSCGQAEQPIHDRLKRTWQHLHFFQFKAYLHAEVPRVRCDGCHKTTQVAVPWARPGSGFTLLMDALVLALAKKLPIAEIAKLYGVSAGRIWQTLNVHVEAARAKDSHEEVMRLGVDEKHVGRSIGFITLFHDATGRRVLFGTQGRNAQTFEAFKSDFLAHGGKAEAVSAVSMDLSKAYRAGAAKAFPEAALCYDAFHLSKLVHEALDTVRREEAKQVADLKGNRWGLLKSPEDWTRGQIDGMHWLQRSGLKTARAWRMKERFKDIHRRATAGELAEPLYRAWIRWARRSRLAPFKKLGKTLMDHLPGILSAYEHKLTNAAAEAINSQVQAAIVRGRGFRNLRHLLNIIYLNTGKLALLPASPFAQPNA